MKQSSSNKNANNKKTETIFAEHQARQKEAERAEEAAKEFAAQGDKILLRIARVATGAAVKWNRVLVTTSNDENHTGHDNRKKEDEVCYLSRLLACTRCGSLQETKEKQLKANVGFRAIHCRSCGKQEKGPYQQMHMQRHMAPMPRA